MNFFFVLGSEKKNSQKPEICVDVSRNGEVQCFFTFSVFRGSPTVEGSITWLMFEIGIGLSVVDYMRTDYVVTSRQSDQD